MPSTFSTSDCSRADDDGVATELFIFIYLYLPDVHGVVLITPDLLTNSGRMSTIG